MQVFKQGHEIWQALQLRIAGVLGVFTHSNTANRSYTLPDKDGTIAMLSDITTQTNMIFATHSNSVGTVYQNSVVTFSVTVTGAVTSDVVVVNPPGNYQPRLSIYASVTSANTITIVVANQSNMVVNSNWSGSWKICVLKVN